MAIAFLALFFVLSTKAKIRQYEQMYVRTELFIQIYFQSSLYFYTEERSLFFLVPSMDLRPPTKTGHKRIIDNCSPSDGRPKIFGPHSIQSWSDPTAKHMHEQNGGGNERARVR